MGSRRVLSSTDALALRTHLVECPSCRFAQQVIEDFKQEFDADLVDDSAAAQGMVEVASRWARRRVTSRVRTWRPVRITALAASLVMVAGTVSAVWLWRRPQAAESLPNAWANVPVRRARVARAAVRAAPEPAAPEPAAPEQPPVSQPAGVRHVSRPLSATLLLQRATEARRRGDVAQAINLYRRLQQAFPTSSEAIFSAAPLGGLLLQRGTPLPAMDQFDRYLRAAPTGVLVPEALYGRGRALQALGNVTEERRTWRRLVDAFPDSPYAPLARRRLADLQ
jgi:TolA-binding protein